MQFRVFTLLLVFVFTFVVVATAMAEKKEKTDTDGPLKSYVKKEKKRSRVFARSSAESTSSAVTNGWYWIEVKVAEGSKYHKKIQTTFSGRLYKSVKANKSGVSYAGATLISSVWGRDSHGYYSTYATV